MPTDAPAGFDLAVTSTWQKIYARGDGLNGVIELEQLGTKRIYVFVEGIHGSLASNLPPIAAGSAGCGAAFEGIANSKKYFRLGSNGLQSVWVACGGTDTSTMNWTEITG